MIRASIAVLCAAALLLSGTGCIVTGSAYDMKVREADALRGALASVNREKARLAGENALLTERLAAGKRTEAELASRVHEMEGSLKRLEEALPGSRKATDGNLLSREQFVDELLAREQATGRRVQDLAARNDACERELAEARRRVGRRDTADEPGALARAREDRPRRPSADYPGWGNIGDP